MVTLKENRVKYILIELAHHLPYSIFGVTLGMILMGLLTFIAILTQTEHRMPEASRELFHVFHPAHILFSSVTTTAMFWKHEKNWVKALVVGFVGSVAICGLSDVVFPLVGGLILGFPMEMHICILQEPGLIFPFAIMGVLSGFLVTDAFERSTEYSHSGHVFISSVACALYLISYGVTDWIHVGGAIFVITVLAVMIPCCASDIAFPLFCVHKNCKHN
jgi:hypothetical protein